MLGALRETMQADQEAGRVRELRTALADLLEKVEYDPETRSAVIRYRLQSGVKLASPRGGHVAPVEWSAVIAVPRR
jgi:hypothetical protein